MALQEVATLWKGLRDLAGRGAGSRKWDEREKRKKETVRRFSRARDGYMEVRDGLAYVSFPFISYPLRECLTQCACIVRVFSSIQSSQT